jgi:hypothetical protein
MNFDFDEHNRARIWARLRMDLGTAQDQARLSMNSDKKTGLRTKGRIGCRMDIYLYCVYHLSILIPLPTARPPVETNSFAKGLAVIYIATLL